MFSFKQTRFWTALSLAAAAIGIAALGFATETPGASHAAAGPNRLFLPQISQDEPVQSQPSASTSATQLATLTPTPTGNSCPGFRSAVANFSDPAATTVNHSPVDSTVAALRAFTRPAGTDFPRSGPAETQSVSVPVQLAQMRQLADRTIELLVAGSTPSETVLVVLPFHTCLEGANPADATAANLARAAVTNACGTPKVGEARPIQGSAVVSGVPFFGPATQDGAPNGIQIRPVFAFQLTGGLACDPLGTPLPSVSPTGTQPPSATATETSVPFVRLTIGSAVQRGGMAGGSVQAQPGRTCDLSSPSAGHIQVFIPPGGIATVSWTVPSTAALGPETVTVTCLGLSDQKTLNIV